jgi:hypothetical protein
MQLPDDVLRAVLQVAKRAQPKLGFVSFFDHHAELGRELLIRARSARSAMVGCDAGAGPQQLWPDKTSEVIVAQPHTKPNHVKRKLS